MKIRIFSEIYDPIFNYNCLRQCYLSEVTYLFIVPQRCAMYRYTSRQVDFPPKWLEFGIFLFEDRQWSPHKMSCELDSLPPHSVFFCLCPHLIYHPYQMHDGSLKSFLLACFCPFILFCSICGTSFSSSDSHSWLPDTYNSTLRFNSSFTSLGFSWPSSCSWINPPLCTESYFLS